jgi:murein hydrolase activator
MKKGIVISTIVLLMFSLAAFATSKHRQLQEINKHIKQVKTELFSNYQQTATIQKELQKNEIARGNLAISQHKTNSQLTIAQSSLNKLEQQKLDYQDRIFTQQKILALQIRSTYMLGQQSYIKILLNQDDATKFSRILMYYGYIQKSRTNLIDELNETINNLQSTQHAITKQTKQLKTIITEQKQQDSNLKQIQQHRSQLLQQIHKKIKTQTQSLQNLIAQKQALEQIIERLQVESIKTQFFKKVGPWRNNLAWPTQGKIFDHFGKSISNSQLKSDGVLIYAPEGQKVFAIAAGKVVFSQWLQGYGLLLIIDHGQGYMSLYGRNNILYHKVGDMISGGDLIAEVGNSGGYEQTGLYFAIRYNGKPVDPAAWCKR